MMLRPGKLLPLLLIPVALYGLAKGVMYYKAKSTIDDMAVSLANHAELRYSGIDTDLSGAVTVKGITVQPRGYEDILSIDAVRVASDDPMMFMFGGDWTSGQEPPPDSLSFVITGINLPLDSEMVADFGTTGIGEPCESGLRVEPALLREMGFETLTVDFDGGYHIDSTERTLELGMHFDVRDVESIDVSATLTDVDAEALAGGGAPQFNLGGFEMVMRVSPEFGRQALKACAAGGDESVQAWGTKLADRAIAEMRQGGINLGYGLQRTVHDFYRDWGELKLVSRPQQPLGLLSLMFLPPDQLTDALALNLSLNNVPVTDTSFTLEKPDMPGLSALLGEEPPEEETKKASAPRRVIVRREYEVISTGAMSQFVDHQVRIKPQGQPLREGLLKGIREGEAVVEQTLHGGKYTVYVPLAQIESAEALVQRQIGTLQ